MTISGIQTDQREMRIVIQSLKKWEKLGKFREHPYLFGMLRFPKFARVLQPIESISSEIDLITDKSFNFLAFN